MNELVEKFEKHISYKYYKHVDGSVVTLVEDNIGGRKGKYQVRFNIDDELIMIKDIEKMKLTKNSNYIIHPPSDCDFVLISMSKKKIYFIELKDTQFDKLEVKEQLQSGQKWADHLLFCANLTNIVDEHWKKINICVKYCHSRPSTTKIKPEEIQDEKIYFVKGNFFNLNKFR